MASNKPNKAQSVRDYRATHRKAKPKQVVEALAKQGIDVNANYVSSIKAKQKTTGKRSKGRRATATPTTATTKAQRPYPQRSIEEALIIPQKIKENNAGNPWKSEDVAVACGTSLKSNKFFYLAAAARDYGVTVGSRDTEKIEISDLGHSIVFAGDEQSQKKHRVEALFNIDIFARVFKHYGGSNSFPKRQQFLSNTLVAEFALPPELHDEFVDIFKRNCEFVGIANGLEAGAEIKSREQAEGTDFIVVGQPKGKFDRTAFVIMPFSEKGRESRPKGFFEEVLNALITPAGNGAGFAIETADQRGTDVIQSTIINKLFSADLVIADLTDHNPNVLFELGIRIAKKLPVALVKASGTGPIFDVDYMMRVAKYNPNLWKTTLIDDLPKLTDHIKATWDNRTTYRNYIEILVPEADGG